MTRVRVPVRVELDVAALPAAPPALEAALTESLTRALARSRTQVFPSRPYAGARPGAPQVHFTGPGLRQARPEELAAAAAAVERAVRAACTAGRLPTGRRPPAGRETDVAAAVAEGPALRMVPSYAGRGARAAVTVRPVGRTTKLRALPVRFAVLRDAAHAAQVLEAGRRARGLPTSTGQAGVIGARADGLYVVWVRDLATRTVLLDVGFELATALVLDTSRKEVVESVTGVPPTASAYRITYMCGAGEVAARTEEFLLDLMRRRLGRSAKGSPEEVDRAVARATPKVHERVLASTAGAKSLLRLVADGVTFLLPLRFDVPERLDAELVPLTEEVVTAAEGTEEPTGAGGAPGGTGGATGTGPRPWPLDPRPGTGRRLATPCEPSVDGEPVLADLGEAGGALQRRMATLATELGIPPCGYLGGFLAYALEAVTVLASRVAASAVGTHGVLVRSDNGNLGPVDFRPGVETEVAALRRLAGLLSLLDDLTFAYVDVLLHSQPPVPGGTRLARLVMEHALDAFRRPVAALFVQTCRVLFLDLLAVSRKGIETRQSDPAAYARAFGTAVLPLLERVEGLADLREALRLRESGIVPVDLSADPIAGVHDLPPLPEDAGTGPVDAGVPEPGQGQGAGAPDPSPWAHLPRPPQRAGVERRDDGVLVVHDGRGRALTAEQLEQERTFTLTTVESFEPLAKQLTDLPDFMAAVRDPARGLQETLTGLLQTMHEANLEIAGQVRGDALYAFGRSSISERLPARPGRIPYQLRGIHQLADGVLTPAFAGSGRYVAGVTWLFDTEVGAASLAGALEFIGVTLIAVLCPPLGAVVGLVVAGVHLMSAAESETTYRALLDPDQVKSWAEVDAELWAARLGMALGFLVIAAEIVALARVALKASAEAAAVGATDAAAATAARAAAARAVTSAVRRAADELAVEFVKALAVGAVLDAVMAAVLGPVIGALVAADLENGPSGVDGPFLDLYVARYEAQVDAELDPGPEPAP
ncbi:hypothetical protein [Modestobacter lapidis]|nr:hypothetical protein [Modestobacter lapidis]